jgi:hypothetical protein
LFRRNAPKNSTVFGPLERDDDDPFRFDAELVGEPAPDRRVVDQQRAPVAVLARE